MKVLTKINRCKMCAMAVLVGSGLTSLFYLLRETQNVEINKNNRDGYLAQVEAEDKLQMTNVACDNNSAKNTQSQMINRNLFDYISYYLRETPYPGVLNYTNYMITFMNMTPLESVEPVLPGFTPVVNDVRSFEYDVELKHCAPADATTLLVVINSAAGNLNRRNAIRQTWLKTLKSEVLNTIRGPNGRRVALAGLVFMIGRKPDGSRYENLKAEREEFGDILEINVVDTYYNLSAKVAALLNWIDSRCSGVDFVLKTDDDIYVNVRNLVSFIHQLDPEQPFLYGKLTHGTVQRGL